MRKMKEGRRMIIRYKSSTSLGIIDVIYNNCEKYKIR